MPELVEALRVIDLADGKLLDLPGGEGREDHGGGGVMHWNLDEVVHLSRV